MTEFFSWAKIMGTPTESALSLLGLSFSDTGDRSNQSVPIYLREGFDDSFILFTFDDGMAERLPLEKLSNEGDVIICSLNRSIGDSFAAIWKDGAQKIAISRSHKKREIYSITCYTDPPPEIVKLGVARYKEQETKDPDFQSSDYMIEVPLDAAELHAQFRYKEGDETDKSFQRVYVIAADFADKKRLIRVPGSKFRNGIWPFIFRILRIFKPKKGKKFDP